MHTTPILQIALLPLLFLLGACQVEKIDPPVAANARLASPAVISTSADGAKAASQVMQTSELIYSTAGLLSTIIDHTNAVIVADPALTSTASISCSDYGSFAYSGTVDQSGVYQLKLTYSLCRDRGFQYDGPVAATGNGSKWTITVGDASSFRVIDYAGRYYDAMAGIVTLSSFAYTASLPVGANSGSYLLVASGTLSSFDYVMLDSYQVAINGTQFQTTRLVNTTTSTKTTNILSNGTIQESWTGGTMDVELTNFAVEKNEHMVSVAGSVGYSGSETVVSGESAFDFGSNPIGINGIITSVTTTPVYHDYSTEKTAAGTVTFTGTGTATVHYNDTGSIDVAVAGSSPVGFAGEYAFFKSVDFFGFEQVSPIIYGTSGSIGSAKASGSRWEKSMSVTAISSGPDLSCYTDVHVNYYAPTDLSTVAWYVDWHIGLVNGCTSPSGIPYQEALDTNGDGVCDAGLDINGADMDVTSGGVEHFTATDLPEGYYVVSINNYSCDPSTMNQATIIIGDYLFGTYTCSYSAWDGEGSTPGAWCRLADIQMHADGSVDVLAPSAAYTPWHN